MSYLPRTKSFAAVGLVLVSVGALAVACGSDKATNANPALTPGEGNDRGNDGPGTTGNGTEPTPGNSTDGTPGNQTPTPVPGNTPGNGEGQTGELPIAPTTPGETPDETGNTPPTPPEQPTITANCSAPEGAVPNLSVQLVANFTQPVFVTGVPGDDTRLLVVEKGGNVRVVLNGELQTAPFINQPVQNQGERGLLGLAFHPDFATNGLFYLHFSSAGGAGLPAAGTSVIAEYQAPGDRSVGDPATRRVVLTVADPEANHNGGMITFGADRMLYIAMGDGGGGDDQHGQIGNGQNLNALLGKLLRIDPAGREVNNAYSNPPQNLAQVTGQQALPEIWQYGLRNPWRFSFDACNGDLYIGDVGQNAQEEIDFVAADTATRTVAAGKNFGWRVAEASICRPMGTEPCNAQVLAGLTPPVDFYAAGNRAQPQAPSGSITGGYVYRGSSIPGLRGTYIYADYARGSFARFRIQNGQAADRVDITAQLRAGANFTNNSIASFGQDNSGELYVASFNPGGVYRIVAAP
ncbi:MAG TPA: PQQ-dependent sugar dehydrogenase [Polyangiaceae bacterium]|nr:PQQ-dependent sugar dehydrogenase [Polyangiaceae bacterium]